MNPIFGFNRGLDYSYLYGSGSLKVSSNMAITDFSDFLNIRPISYPKVRDLFFDKKKIIAGIKPSEFPKAKYKSLSNVKSFSKALENTALSLSGTDFKDKKEALKAAKSFTTAYNNLIESSADTENASILRREVFLTGRTATFSKQLEEVGIHIEKNNTLSIDEEVFMKQDDGVLMKALDGQLGFAQRVGRQAAVISRIAENQMNSINKTYNKQGKFYGYAYATRIYEAV